MNKLKNLQNRNCIEGNSEDLEHIDCSDQWPENYLDKLGKWTGKTLQRPSQGTIEQRETLD